MAFFIFVTNKQQQTKEVTMKKILLILAAFALTIMTGCGADGSTIREEYKSSVPAKFLRTAQNDVIDTMYVTVKNCDETESYRIPVSQYEYFRNGNKILIKEFFTGEEYVFNGKDYKLIVNTEFITHEYGCSDSDQIIKQIRQKEMERAKAAWEYEKAQREKTKEKIE